MEFIWVVGLAFVSVLLGVFTGSWAHECLQKLRYLHVPYESFTEFGRYMEDLNRNLTYFLHVCILVLVLSWAIAGFGLLFRSHLARRLWISFAGLGLLVTVPLALIVHRGILHLVLWMCWTIALAGIWLLTRPHIKGPFS